MINGAKDFVEYASKIINGVSCLYLAENEIMTETEDIETSPKIPRTLKVHKLIMKIIFVKWSFTSLLTKQTRLTFSGTAKRSTRKFVGASVSIKLVLKSNQHLSCSFSLFCSKVFMFI